MQPHAFQSAVIRWHVVAASVWCLHITASCPRAFGEEPAATEDRTSTIDPDEVDGIFRQMISQGPSFDPTRLVQLGKPGCRAILSRVFPEALGGPAAMTRERALELVAQLGADAYEARAEATSILFREGRSHAGLVEQAANAGGPLVATRAARILRLWQAADAHAAESLPALQGALQRYAEKLTDEATLQEMAACVVAALTARVDKLPEKRLFLYTCAQALAQSKADSVHEIVVPLVKHEDPAVPILVMQAISGRTGNSYVAPIHMAALESGRPELFKAALRSMPCPIWDQRALPKVREALRKIFTDPEFMKELQADTNFMMLTAFVAARDFRIPEATTYLLKQIGSDDRQVALRAISALGDTRYLHHPVSDELLTAIEPHLSSEDAALRDAAVTTLGRYKGEVVLHRMITAIGDADAKVSKSGALGLVNQHFGYPAGESPVMGLLIKARGVINNAKTLERIDHLVAFFSPPAGSRPLPVEDW